MGQYGRQQPYKKIVVGVDGSEPSLHALRETLRFARNEGAEVFAISVVPPYEGDLRLFGVKNIKAMLREPCEKALAVTKKAAEEENVSVRTLCAEGVPHEEIIGFAESHGCDLIVVGTKGYTLEKVFLGSVASKVVGESTVEVLAIPAEGRIGWSRILCATDGSPWGEAAVSRGLSLARIYQGEVFVVSATDLPQELCEEVPAFAEGLARETRERVENAAARLKSEDVRGQCLLREGSAYKAILELASEKGVDIIVMGSHGKTGFKRLLMGSVVERVLARTPCPVLVVKGTASHRKGSTLP